MSVSPTEDALIVALDFEGVITQHTCVNTSSEIPCAIGVHSLERSAQEDTLLVLFNTAISNLVSDQLTASIHFRSHRHRSYSVTTLLLAEISAASFSPSSPARLYWTRHVTLHSSNQRLWSSSKYERFLSGRFGVYLIYRDK